MKCTRFRHYAAGLVLLIVPTISFAQSASDAARSLELRDYFQIRQVRETALSPDGRRVAFVQSRSLEQENRRHRGIWLVATDGMSDPVRLTSSTFSASNPAWSPDGSLLAFSSSRPLPSADDGNDSSVWFLRMDGVGGEAFQIPGVGGTPIFSPDARWIAFTMPTPPGPKPQETYASDFNRQIAEKFDGRIYDWMDYRYDGRGYLPDPRDAHATPPDELYILPREGGTARQLTDLGVDVSGAAWSDDGGALAFTADTDQRDEHTYERADLWVVDLKGQTRRLTDNGMDYSSPAWSPDGRTIVVRGSQGLDMVLESGQMHGSPIDLYLFPAEGGEPRNLTADWDLSPGTPRWSPDGGAIYFSARITGNTHLFRIAVDDGQVEQVTRGERELDDFSFSEDFQRITYVATEPTNPGDVYTADINGASERRLTQVNRELFADLELSRPEPVTFRSRDGTQVEGWVMPPVGFRTDSGEQPMIFTIHGGPHGAYGNDFSFERQLYAGKGYFVFFSNPRGSTGYGEDFKWAIWYGWGRLDYQDLMAGVDHVVDNYPVDTERMGVAGGSYGGFMTNWVITQTDRFAAAAARASISNWVSDYGTSDIPRTKERSFGGPPWEEESLERLLEYSPVVHADGVSTPTLFLHGEWDYRVPIAEGEQMYVALRKQKVPAKFVRYPESYHGGWTPWRQLHSWKTQLDWWDRWLSRRPDVSQP